MNDILWGNTANWSASQNLYASIFVEIRQPPFFDNIRNL